MKPEPYNDIPKIIMIIIIIMANQKLDVDITAPGSPIFHRKISSSCL